MATTIAIIFISLAIANHAKCDTRALFIALHCIASQSHICIVPICCVFVICCSLLICVQCGCSTTRDRPIEQDSSCAVRLFSPMLCVQFSIGFISTSHCMHLMNKRAWTKGNGPCGTVYNFSGMFIVNCNPIRFMLDSQNHCVHAKTR